MDFKGINFVPVGESPILYENDKGERLFLEEPFEERDSFLKWFQLCERKKIKKWKYMKVIKHWKKIN